MQMLNLSLLMLERVGIVIILAFLLVNVRPFRQLLFAQRTISNKINLIIIFAFFAIISNITGIEIDSQNHLVSTGILLNLPDENSIANTRLLAVTVSGIIGGPSVGAVVGLIAGLHRVIQGGLAAWFYIPSSAIIGGLAGIFYHRRASKPQPMMLMSPTQGIVVGFAMEVIQMLFILLFSPTGWQLVKFIAIPMITINALGTFIFLSIIDLFLTQEQEMRAVQTHDVLELADRTLPYFRAGLNQQSAASVAKIIKEYTNFSAISLTTTTEILAHVGAGSDHHVAGAAIVTRLSSEAIQHNEIRIAHSKAEIGCSHPDCPLEAAIVIPLDVNQQVVGTLKMYSTDAARLTPVEEQLARGLASIFSSQIALGAAENQSKLVKDAEIKSLQAQINPHFFFNAINTISATIRHDTEKARSLLIQLSTYFRSNLVGVRETEITLAQEQAHVNAYLTLEQTRFPDKYQIKFDFQTNEHVMLPPFTIQVLVENAIKHAFVGKASGNQIRISVTQVAQQLKIEVADNGSGINPALIQQLGKQPIASTHGSGTALQNLNQRLTGLYGQASHLQFQSTPHGTTVTTYIPLKEHA
ncbi:histidine kinase [Paucilactobacillus vaccinostercus DSM 20634]|uniref:Histidine kinase n=2 Tax=Paucilactobacillus vaccinostercus TaxID=176291 RepID=A0A0R2AGR7_9LACO|nr:histidine kinase [Paucilactobacillus vaccinostercus DSM 20634]